MFDLDHIPLPPESAIEQLAHSRCGFLLVDLGITPQDLADFEQIEISGKWDYNRCGELDKIEGEVAVFLARDNDPEIARRVAHRTAQIAHRILEASKKDTAWVWLRACVRANASSQLRWHFDWPFYTSEERQYRFVMTLRGPPTIFYPLPVDNTELRQKIWGRPGNYGFVTKLCEPSLAFTPNRDVGVVFINRERGALHAEPSTFDQGRLFLSIVPCSQEQMLEVEPRVKEHFNKKTSH